MAPESSLILGKYHVLTHLGAGAYGRVVHAKEVSESSTEYAIKLERASKKRPRPPSEHEANVLRILADPGLCPHIPRVVDYGYDKPTHSKALVLDLLGASIQDLHRKCGGQICIKTALILATQLIPTIRYIHSKGFVHRDIKPGNMLLGSKDNENRVYIVDFGIARRYRNPRNGAHMPYLDGKSVIGTVRYASLNTHLGIAQTRRDDIECLAFSLLDCLRDLPWGNIIGGSPKQFEDRVREKKRSWTPDRLCAGIPNAFKELLSHARQLRFDEEPDYDRLQQIFVDELKLLGHSANDPFDWSQAGSTKDFVPIIARQLRASPAVYEGTRKFLDSIRPGDFIKLKLLGPATVQFSGRFNSVDTDPSFWESPSLSSKKWEFPYRPAIVASVKRDVVVRKGKKGLTLSVYPLMTRKEGLEGFSEHIRKRFIRLDSSMLDLEGAQHECPLGNTYVYNTCVTLTVSVDPRLMPADVDAIHWRLKSSGELEKVTAHLQEVRPPLEAGQEIEAGDGDETIGIKTGKRRILQTVLAEIGGLTVIDAEGQGVVWSGRNGWLKEYNQIGGRRDDERQGSDDEGPMVQEDYDSDYIFDSVSPPGERRKSCTVHSDADYLGPHA